MDERQKGRSRRRVRTAAIVGAALIVTAASVPAAAYPRPGRTERVSVASDGTEGSSWSSGPSISADGRYVAFTSLASNLVPGITNRVRHVFVHDRETATTEHVSVASDGGEGNSSSSRPSISADGRYVAFDSVASNLVPGDTNQARDIFVHDRETATTERVSVAADGGEANGDSELPAISADGRHVAFASRASNLVEEDANGASDVFVYDRETGVVERVSVSSDGVEGNGGSVSPAISADGRYVAFGSGASNLVPDDTNAAADVFVHDRATGTTERVSVASDGREALASTFSSQPLLSGAPAISADGRHVAFLSSASNLVPGDTNNTWDVFVRDRVAGATERVSVASDGSESRSSSSPFSALDISADGRHVAFGSFASNLVPGTTNDTWDVFVRDRVAGATERVSVASDGSEAEFTPSSASSVAISADGRSVAFSHFASNLVPGVTNNNWDVFVRDRGETLGLVGELTGTVLAGSLAVEGTATLSGVILASATDPADDGVPGASEVGAELTGAAVVYRPEHEDLLLRIEVASFPDRCQPALGTSQCVVRDQVRARCLVSPCPIPEAGLPGVVYGAEFQAGDNRYEVRILEVAADGILDSRIPYVALYECAAVCLEVASLSGSIGSTGNEILASVPLATLGVQEGQQLSSLRVFAGAGEAAPGAVVALDEMELPDAPVPVAGAQLGIAPAGTPESEVAFDTPAELEEGRFSGSLDVSSLAPGDYEMWARVCLGETCSAASETVPSVDPQ